MCEGHGLEGTYVCAWQKGILLAYENLKCMMLAFYLWASSRTLLLGVFLSVYATWSNVKRDMAERLLFSTAREGIMGRERHVMVWQASTYASTREAPQSKTLHCGRRRARGGESWLGTDGSPLSNRQDDSVFHIYLQSRRRNGAKWPLHSVSISLAPSWGEEEEMEPYRMALCTGTYMHSTSWITKCVLPLHDGLGTRSRSQYLGPLKFG